MLCCVLAEKDIESMVKVALSVSDKVDLFEVRLDYLENPEEEDFSKLDNIKNKKIVTCMPSWEGGLFKKSEEERISVLKNASEFSQYITIELKTDKKFLDEILELGKGVIISYHNFECCPKKNEILKIIEEEEKAGGGRKIIKKVAFKFNSFEDNFEVMPILTEKKFYKNIIALGMGRYGKLTRIMNYYFGFLTYVSATLKTAEGQFTSDDFRKIIELIENKHKKQT